jgi:hypothetical protein
MRQVLLPDSVLAANLRGIYMRAQWLELPHASITTLQLGRLTKTDANLERDSRCRSSPSHQFFQTEATASKCAQTTVRHRPFAGALSTVVNSTRVPIR